MTGDSCNANIQISFQSTNTNSQFVDWHEGPPAEYQFWLFLPKYGYDSLKTTRNSAAIPVYFQLRLARILKELSQKHIRLETH